MFQDTKWQEDRGVSIVTLMCHFASAQSPAPAVLRHLHFPVSTGSELCSARCADANSVMPSPGQPTLPSPLYLTSFQLLLLFSLFSLRLSIPPSTLASRFCAIGHWRVISLPGSHPLQNDR